MCHTYRRLRQENGDFEASQGCMARPCLKEEKQKKNKQKKKKNYELRQYYSISTSLPVYLAWKQQVDDQRTDQQFAHIEVLLSISHTIQGETFVLPTDPSTPEERGRSMGLLSFGM